MNVLIWLKRDLRTFDHPAFAMAAEMGRVLPLYVVEPEYWAQPDASARHWGFVAESLQDLAADLARRGAPLIVRTGDAVEILDRLCRQNHIARILSHEETGNAWTYARDKRVAAWARSAGVQWVELPQAGVVRRLANRDRWSGQRNAFVAAAQSVTPDQLSPVPGLEPGLIPSAKALRLAEDRCRFRQQGGRSTGLGLLDSFLTQRGEPYRSAMSSPLSAERACSRISAHLAYGTLSIREVVQATRARQAERAGGRWGGALSSFQSRLAWRDHFVQKLEDAPEMEWQCLDPTAEKLHRVKDAARLAAWEKGETGLPFLDACMRYLAATGWLNFRMRAMVQAAASYHLWLDWRASGQYLARSFTDYEPGIHWPQVQMQSGTTGINTPRIYNPVKQGYDQDPTGAFTRRWLPELANVPDAFLQEPWKWPGFQAIAGRRYPEPIIDATVAQRAARDAVWALRKAPDHRTLAKAIADRHASRSPVRRTGAKQSPKPASQLSLDL